MLNVHVILYSEYERGNSSADTWLSIVSLAHQWQFETISNFAFQKYIHHDDVKFNPMDILEARQKYGFDRSMVSEAYLSMRYRGYPLSYKEGERLGQVESLLIALIRDRMGSDNLKHVEVTIAQFETHIRK